MGASQSRTEAEEKVFQSETPVSFSPDVVNQLSDRVHLPEASLERQSTLDAHIRSRIHAELEHLRQQEEDVRREIESALEKENLDRERNAAHEASDDTGSNIGDVRSSAALMGDLEEIRTKIEKYQSKRDLEEFQAVNTNGAAVAECYKNRATTPLDCWREVENFKQSVSQLEQQCFKSLQ